ncbi:MAG: DUF6127 family protein [Hyphomicrobiales bacterium]
MTPPRKLTAPERPRRRPTAAASQADINAMIDAAAKRAAKEVLADLGIDNGHAARDIRDLRSLLDAIRTARRTFVQTLIRIFTTGLILVIMAGLAVKLKLFKGD